MSKFIYVFTEKDRDILLSRGYSLLKADNNNNKLFIFKNNETMTNESLTFSLSGGDVIFTNTLTF